MENSTKNNNNREVKKEKFNFSKFYACLPQHKTKEMLSIEYLTWFIGIFEANGNFEKDGRVNITQKILDIKLLYSISTTMGMGSVIKHNKPVEGNDIKKATARWRTKASEVEVAVRIAMLFNENIVTSSKLQSFKKWCVDWMKNEKFKKLVGPDFIVQSKAKPGLMAFNNGWLSGFIDGDGHWGITFSIVNSKSHPVATIRMCVAGQGDTKWIEDAITVLNIGRRDPKNGEKNVKWTVSKKSDLDILIEYIKNYPHKTLKAVSFSKFCKLRRRILKKEHYGTGYEKIKALSLEINKFY